MFPRVTHPSAADVLLRPLDLHVLSLPPAFALSQDQTLKLDLNFEPADHNVGRGPTIIGHNLFSSIASMVLPLNVYRRSLRPTESLEKIALSTRRGPQGL